MSVVAFVGTSQLTQDDAVNDQVLDAEDRTSAGEAERAPQVRDIPCAARKEFVSLYRLRAEVYAIVRFG